MKSRIEKLSGHETLIVRFSPFLWYSLLMPYGWIPILRRLESTIYEIRKSTPDSKVTLIGHSIGGILGLLYIISPPGRGFDRKLREVIDHLVTLGSPHKNRCRWLHGGSLSRLIEKYGESDKIESKVRLTCIAGKSILGSKHGTASERKAYAIYKTIGGQGEVWGDGIVPVTSALLPGADTIVLENTGHFSSLGQAWYGSQDIVSRWWTMIQSA